MGEINRGGLPYLDPKSRSGFEKPPEPEIFFEIGERVKSEIEKSRGESRTISTFPDFRLKIGVSFYFILIYPDFSQLFLTFPDFSRLFPTFPDFPRSTWPKISKIHRGKSRKILDFTRFYSQKVGKNRVFHLENRAQCPRSRNIPTFEIKYAPRSRSRPDSTRFWSGTYPPRGSSPMVVS